MFVKTTEYPNTSSYTALSLSTVGVNNRESQIRVCFRDEIDESMASSKGAYKEDSPWKKYFEAMALVVPIRKMGKNLGLPLRVEEYDSKE